MSFLTSSAVVRTSLAGVLALAMLAGFATTGFSQQLNSARHSANRGASNSWICKFRRQGHRQYRQRVFSGARARQDANRFARQLREQRYVVRVYPVIRQPKPQPSRFHPSHLVGKPLWWATKIAKKHGYVLRVVSKDGKAMIGTQDYRTDRINVDIRRGKVVGARIG